MQDNDTSTQATMTGINLTPVERKIVDDFRKNYGLNFSAALRFIINDWAVLKNIPAISDGQASEKRDSDA